MKAVLAITAAIIVIAISVVGCYLVGRYWLRNSRRGLWLRVKDAWVTIPDSDKVRRDQYYEDISRISCQIDAAFLPAHWDSITEQIDVFSVLFGSWKETGGIVETWKELIRDRKTVIHLEDLNKVESFN